MPDPQYAPPLDDVDMFDEEATIEHGLNEIERLGRLEQESRIAAELIVDLQDRGPLYRYVKKRRELAVAALRILIDTVPDSQANVARILEAQASFREYRRVIQHIHAGLEGGELAAEAIRQEYGDDDNARQDGDLLQEPEFPWRRRR